MGSAGAERLGERPPCLHQSEVAIAKDSVRFTFHDHLPWASKHDLDQDQTQKILKTHTQVKDMAKTKTSDRIFEEFFEDFCTITTKNHEHEHEDKHEQH